MTEDVIKARVHEELEHWKRIHEADLDRKARWSWIRWGATFVGFLLGLVAGFVSVDTMVGKRVDSYKSVYSSALSSMTAGVLTEAENAKASAKKAAAEADKAAAAARDKFNELIQVALGEATSRDQMIGQAISKQLDGLYVTLSFQEGGRRALAWPDGKTRYLRGDIWTRNVIDFAEKDENATEFRLRVRTR